MLKQSSRDRLTAIFSLLASLFLLLRVESLSSLIALFPLFPLLSSHFLFLSLYTSFPSRVFFPSREKGHRSRIHLLSAHRGRVFSFISPSRLLSPAPSYNELVGFLLTNVRAREKFTSASRNRTRVAPRRRASYRRHAAGVATTMFFFSSHRILSESEILYDAPISRTIRTAEVTARSLLIFCVSTNLSYYMDTSNHLQCHIIRV